MAAPDRFGQRSCAPVIDKLEELCLGIVTEAERGVGEKARMGIRPRANPFTALAEQACRLVVVSRGDRGVAGADNIGFVERQARPGASGLPGSRWSPT